MTTIQPFAAGSYNTDRTTTNLLGLKSRLDGLTTQLSTGRAAQTYGGLGAGRTTSLSAHAAISTLDGYVSAIGGATTRVSLATQSLTQIKTLGDTLNSSLLTALQSTNSTGVGNSVGLARNDLDAAVDALNQEVDGQYIFGGRATDAAPVVSTDLMLDGDADTGLAGLKTLIAEQRAADLGVGGNGRLTQTQTGTSVSLSEDPSAEARANFGFSLVSATSSGSGVSSSRTAGTQPSVALAFATQPAAGDTITLKLGLHDGTTQTITLTAAASADATSASSFAIGATPAQTAANLSTALGNALKLAADTALSASSATRASQNFFDGSASSGLAPRRVAGDGNGYAETASRSTVIWYKGDDAATDPRDTASVQVGANRSVAVGARANEAPIRATLAAFAALAGGTATDASGANAVTRFQAAADRARLLVAPTDGRSSVADIASDFAIASNGMADAKTQAQASKATLQNALDGVESVSTEEVAAKLLTLQTQLQASYQVTSMLSKLSLVNYMS